MKQIDLDAMDRTAQAATQDEWEWRNDDDILEGVHDGQVVMHPADAVDDVDPIIVASVSDRAHIAANSPPVTRALIARIRELESALTEACDRGSTGLL